MFYKINTYYYIIIFILIIFSYNNNVNAVDIAIDTLDPTTFVTNFTIIEFTENLLFCSSRKCAELGFVCDSVYPYSGPMCYQPYRCVDSICIEPILTGMPCNHSGECDNLKGEYCVSTVTDPVKRCRVANYAQFGEKCEFDYHCMLGLDCVPSDPNNPSILSCGTPTTGCTNDGQCNRSSVCNLVNPNSYGGGVCQTLNLTRDQCTIFTTIDDCGARFCTPYANNSNIGQCRNETEVGDLCTINKITCNTLRNQYCRPYTGSLYGTCQMIPKPSYRLCYSYEDCESYEFCRCDIQASIGYCTTRFEAIGLNCQNSLEVYFECVAKYNCSYVFNLHPMSCGYRNCPKEANCLRSFCTVPLLSNPICAREYDCDITKAPRNFTSQSSKNINSKMNWLFIKFILILIYLFN